MNVDHIFRSYDIRGIYQKDLDEEIMRRIGNALGQISKAETIVVASDMRISSKPLKNELISGLLSAGKNVIDAGLLPLGVGMFFAWQRGYEFAYITGSHLPKEWNGVKFFHASGIPYLDHEILTIRDIFNHEEKKVENGKLSSEKNEKTIKDYINYVSSKIKLTKKLNVVLDCGNGMASLVAPELFRIAGAEVVVIYGELDGTFPNRNPEPAEDELEELRKKVKGKDLGVAYDGDGDRMVLVDETGRKLSTEEVSVLLLKSLKQKGPIVANVECTRTLDKAAAEIGKTVIRCPVGHTYLMEHTTKNKACFGVEFSGHYVIPSIFPFDDSLAISLYTAFVVAESNETLSEIAESVEVLPFKRINFECDDIKKFKIVNNLKTKLSQQYENISTMDGVRIDVPEGWVLLRASNTSPTIRLTIEANSDEKLKNMEKEFSEILRNEISRS